MGFYSIRLLPEQLLLFLIQEIQNKNYEAFEHGIPERRVIQQAEVDVLQRQLQKLNSERQHLTFL
ncbi:hypothetical protein AB4K20DRAFT_1917454 [Rhizopus microsporus]